MRIAVASIVYLVLVCTSEVACSNGLDAFVQLGAGTFSAVRHHCQLMFHRSALPYARHRDKRAACSSASNADVSQICYSGHITRLVQLALHERGRRQCPRGTFLVPVSERDDRGESAGPQQNLLYRVHDKRTTE